MANEPTSHQVAEDLETSTLEAAGCESESLDVEQEGTTLSSIEKSLTICFSIPSNYSPSWNTSSAFRELVQNWRDGIVRSFNLKETQFHVVKENKSTDQKDEILFKALKKAPGVPDHDSCMGFIRFFGGIIEITNRAASLQPKHLDFGQSDKTRDDSQAGFHGEGLKLALLVFLRQNFRVRCISGNTTWNFNFTTAGKLVARLDKMQREAIIKEKKSTKKLKDDNAVPFQASPYHDVRFFIGEKGKGRNRNGKSTQRKHVKLGAFNKWCRSALFLSDLPNQEKTIITTEYGDLILDGSVRGNLYLKGLLLKEFSPGGSASVSGLKLKYAYNFRHGETNRDRQSRTHSIEEYRTILNIWNDVLQLKPNLIAALHGMLVSTNPFADVHLAESLMGIDSAHRLRDHLFYDRAKWYYSDEEMSKDPRLKIIMQGLAGTGSRLPGSYWWVLARFHLIRTAKEEQEDRFMKSRIAMVSPANKFAESLDRLLRSCLQGIPGLDNIDLVFVRAGQLHLHTYLKDSKFKIHERWLDSEQVVSELKLSSDVPESDVLFHAAQWLVRELIDQIPEDKFLRSKEGTVEWDTVEWDKRKVTNYAVQRLLEFTNVNNSVTLQQAPSGNANELILEWNRFSSWCQVAAINVQLHHEASCRKLHDRLLSTEFNTKNLPCRKLQEGPTEDVKPIYFAMITKHNEPGSIALFSETCKVLRLPAEVVDLTMDEVPALTQSAISHHSLESQSQSETSQVPLISVDNVSSRSEYEKEEEGAPSFCAGKPIENLDLEPRDWYEARSPNVEGAVIGIPKPTSTKGRKRRREQHDLCTSDKIFLGIILYTRPPKRNR
ncbi:unnamed protein product [Clonostachys byssicola]|uniref:Uncharacterized protein n=1 Tax=Clonostachys byssicola TaxID=160290 RepID=A0A9N9V2I1_9HYPO|nr:unnamed protein product [Clonostachys byssicola]